MSQKRIFITGGASGLGRALADRYAASGWSVCIADVNELRGADALSGLQVKAPRAHFLRCDVTQEGDLEVAARWLEQNWGGVDIVVNNAGVAVGGGIDEVPIDDWRWILDINLLGVVRGCKVFTPVFRRGGGGRFVNIASMAGLVHPPMMAAYNASKAAVVALSETLRLELARDNIEVSVVCPAFFRTNLTESLRASSPDVQRITHKLVNKSRHSAERIAELVHKGVDKGDFHILTHGEGQLAWMMKRLTPYSLFSRFFEKNTRGMMGRQNLPQEPSGDEAPRNG